MTDPLSPTEVIETQLARAPVTELRRSVPVGGGVGTSPRRRGRVLAACGGRIMISTAAMALMAGFIFGPRVMHCFCDSKADVTKVELNKLAFEAFPTWLATHPGQTCPGSLTDLNEYMSNDRTEDAWGRPIVYGCTAAGLWAASAGQDHVWNTADDLWSDR